jgi:hypothetical protein
MFTCIRKYGNAEILKIRKNVLEKVNGLIINYFTME